MTKLSQEQYEEIEEFGPVTDRLTTIDGYTIEQVTFLEDSDLDDALATLPGGHCSCPHWGYIIKGEVTVRYADHDEVLVEGDTFYMAPGHKPYVKAGTVFSMTSPADQLAATDAAIKAAMQAAHASS